jgi:hypothetical protein
MIRREWDDQKECGYLKEYGMIRGAWNDQNCGWDNQKKCGVTRGSVDGKENFGVIKRKTG